MVQLKPSRQTSSIPESSQLEVETYLRATDRIRFLNITLILLTLVSMSVFYIPLHKPGIFFDVFIRYELFFEILLTIFSVYFPVRIGCTYPELKFSTSNIQYRPLMTLRMNSIGVLILPIVINLIYHYFLNWWISYYCAIAMLYVLSMMLALRPVMGTSIAPPQKWKLVDFLYKTGLLVIIVVLMKGIWENLIHAKGALIETDFSDIIITVLSLSALLPFYIAYAISWLPESDISITHEFNDADIKGKFAK